MQVYQIAWPEELHERAKKAAKEEGVSLAGFIRKAVIKYLESIGK